MKIHKLKYKGKKLCDAVYKGEKLYEIRKNDRNYSVGDLIYPIPVDEDGVPMEHPLEGNIYKITHLTTWEGIIKEGYCVFGVEYVGSRNLSNST